MDPVIQCKCSPWNQGAKMNLLTQLQTLVLTDDISRDSYSHTDNKRPRSKFEWSRIKFQVFGNPVNFIPWGYSVYLVVHFFIESFALR